MRPEPHHAFIARDPSLQSTTAARRFARLSPRADLDELIGIGDIAVIDVADHQLERANAEPRTVFWALHGRLILEFSKAADKFMGWAKHEGRAIPPSLIGGAICSGALGSVAGGYPHSIQVVGHHLVDLDINGNIEQDDWEKAIRKTATELQEPDRNWETFGKSASRESCKILDCRSTSP